MELPSSSLNIRNLYFPRQPNHVFVVIFFLVLRETCCVFGQILKYFFLLVVSQDDILFLNLNGKYLLIKIIILIKGVELWSRFIILPKELKCFLLLSFDII